MKLHLIIDKKNKYIHSTKFFIHEENAQNYLDFNQEILIFKANRLRIETIEVDNINSNNLYLLRNLADNPTRFSNIELKDAKNIEGFYSSLTLAHQAAELISILHGGKQYYDIDKLQIEDFNNINNKKLKISHKM